MRKEAALVWAKGLSRRKGQAELIKHQEGGRLTAQQVINGICYRCSSGYDTGLGCTVADCPGVQRNPYNTQKNKVTVEVEAEPEEEAEEGFIR